MTRRITLVSLACAVLSASAPAQTEVRYEDQRIISVDPRGLSLGWELTFAEERLFASQPADNLLAPASGSVWELIREPQGLSLVRRIAADPVEIQQLGLSLDIGDDLLVASTSYLNCPDACAVYVYDASLPGTPRIATIEPPPGLPFNSGYGEHVAVVDRRTVAITLRRFGAVLIYRESGGAWHLAQELRPPVANSNYTSAAGASLDVHGGFLIVGGVQYRAWIYERDGSGRFRLSQTLEDPDINGSSGFGQAVAIEEGLVAVGDPRRTGQSTPWPGRVFVYRRSGVDWELEAELVASDGFAAPGTIGGVFFNDRFGDALSIDDGRLLIGAPKARRSAVPTFQNPGSAYLFERENGAWVERTRLWHTGRESQAGFGRSVDLDGDTAVVGAPRDLVGIVRSGSLNVYHLPFGESVCAGAPNSTGLPATIELTGERRVALAHLDVEASSVPSGSIGYPLASRVTDLVHRPGGAAGTLCVGAPVSRFPHLARTAGSGRRLDFSLDTSAFPTPPVGTVALRPGDRWVFQVWYRDAESGESNFSAAAVVTFR